MKTRRILASLLALAAASLAIAALAADQKKEQPAKAENKAHTAEWAGLFGGASLPVVWQSASAANGKIAAAIAAKKLDGVADWAETIHLASHALEDQVKLPDVERAKRLKSTLEMAAKIADDVLDGANHNEVDQTADAHRRLSSALALAKSRLPKEILDAPPQSLRFAKASGHAHDAKGDPKQKK